MGMEEPELLKEWSYIPVGGSLPNTEQKKTCIWCCCYHGSSSHRLAQVIEGATACCFWVLLNLVISLSAIKQRSCERCSPAHLHQEATHSNLRLYSSTHSPAPQAFGQTASISSSSRLRAFRPPPALQDSAFLHMEPPSPLYIN